MVTRAFLGVCLALCGPGCGRFGFEGEPGLEDAAPGDAGSDAPAELPWPGCVADVAVSTLTTCILFRDGHVECAGQNGRGELGDGTGLGSTTFVRARGLDDAIALRPGAWGTCAIRADRTVWCWGDAANLRFGTLEGYVTAPTQVAVGTVLDFSTGSTSSCAVGPAGEVSCMGQNNVGQLGDGTTTASATPVEVPLPAAALAVTSAWDGHAALFADGRVLAWGYNGLGRWSVPTDPGLDAVVEVSAHAPVFVARRSDGSVWAWGRNADGQLGDGTVVPRTTAAPVQGIATARSVAGGGSHACAVLASGEVTCWGDNGPSEKLGVSAIDISSVPITVPGLPPALVVRAGQEHTCAIVSDGAVWCWGLDSSGQMGLGSTADARPPTPLTIACE